ncbi:MAG: hypothetical protein JNK14_07610 [Chitinophagaceae bacterium]|nr:hypothetical protein [Chitinophagaceae bacterium]
MKIHYLVFICLLGLACSQNEPNSIIEIEGRKIDTDTIRYLPVDEVYGKQDIGVNAILGIDSLKRDSNLVEFRIIRYNFNPELIQFFTIKKRSGRWSGYAVTIKSEYNYSRSNHRYVPELHLQETPRSGWDSLGRQILGLQILEIGKTLPVYAKQSMDMGGVTVEYNVFGTSFGRFSVEGLETQKSPGGIRMNIILNVIEKELGFRIYSPVVISVTN